MTILIILLCWVIYAILEGKRDGEFYHNRITSSEPTKSNIHWIFSVERIFIGTLIFFYSNTFQSVLNSSIFIIILSLIFSWFHNGMYYFTRNKLNPTIYYSKWFDESLSSTAYIELSYLDRLLLMILGFGLLTTLF